MEAARCRANRAAGTDAAALCCCFGCIFIDRRFQQSSAVANCKASAGFFFCRLSCWPRSVKGCRAPASGRPVREQEREAAAVAAKEEEGQEETTTFSSSSSASSSASLPSPLSSPPADSSPPVVPDAGAAESAALLDAIREIEEEEAEAAAEEANAAAAAAAETEAEEEAKAVASEPAPEAKRAAAAFAAAPSPSRSSSDSDDTSSSLTPEERERKEAAAADLSLARSRGDAAAAAVAFARLRDADAERDSDADEEEEEEEEKKKEKKWRPFKMKDQSEEEEEEEEERREEATTKKEASSSSTARNQQQQQEQPHIAPPFDARWPSPAGVAFEALPGAPQLLSLSSALPPEYDATVGGRGLPLTKNTVPLTSFAAARAAREAARRADRYGREPEDLMAAENERPRPRRETMLTAGLVGVAKANAYGAKPDDIPVVAATPLLVSDWKNSNFPKPKDGKEASRVVIDKSSSSVPFELTFAANAAVDQPTRRFRPPDQSLCVGNGVVITGNNLVLRTWDAETGAPLQGPIAQPDFFGLDGNFSDPVCIFDSQDSKRFFVGVFRFGEGATKYSQFVLSVSKTSNPADGFLGPYIFRNDGLDREGKPLPGLDDCGGDDGEEESGKKGVSTEKKGTDSSSKKKKNTANDDDSEKDDGDKSVGDKSDRTEAAAAAPKKGSTKKKVSPGCLGDYPAVGLDSNAFVATFNLFQTEPEEKYAGVLLLAIDKKGLLSGKASQPAFVAYSNFNAEISYTVVSFVFWCSLPLFPSFKRKKEREDFHLSRISLSTTSTFFSGKKKKKKQPSQTQAGTPHDPSRGGTLYLASTGPCTQNEPNVNMVAAWAITNTSALNSPGFGVVIKSGDSSPSSPSWTIPSISKAALVEVPAYRDPGAFVSIVGLSEGEREREKEREKKVWGVKEKREVAPFFPFRLLSLIPSTSTSTLNITNKSKTESRAPRHASARARLPARLGRRSHLTTRLQRRRPVVFGADGGARRIAGRAAERRGCLLRLAPCVERDGSRRRGRRRYWKPRGQQRPPVFVEELETFDPGRALQQALRGLQPEARRRGLLRRTQRSLPVEACHHCGTRRHSLGLCFTHGAIDFPDAGRREGRFARGTPLTARFGALPRDFGPDGTRQEVQGQREQRERGQRGREQDGEPEGR